MVRSPPQLYQGGSNGTENQIKSPLGLYQEFTKSQDVIDNMHEIIFELVKSSTKGKLDI